MRKNTAKTATPPRKAKIEIIEEEPPTTEIKLLIVDNKGNKIDATTKEEKEGFKRYLAELREQKDINTFGDIVSVTVKKRLLIVEIQGSSLSDEDLKGELIKDFKEVDFEPENRSLELALYEKKKKNKESPNGTSSLPVNVNGKGENGSSKIVEGESVDVPIKKEKTYSYVFKFVPHIDGRRVQLRDNEKNFISIIYDNYNKQLKDKPYKFSLPGMDNEYITFRLISTSKLEKDVIENIGIDLADLYTKERSANIRDLYLRSEENSETSNEKLKVKHVSSYTFRLTKYSKELEEEILDKLFVYGNEKHKGVVQKRVRASDGEIIVILECTKFDNPDTYITNLLNEFITLEPVEKKNIVYLQFSIANKNNVILENIEDRKQKDILTVVDNVLNTVDEKIYSLGVPTITNGIIEIPLKMKKMKIEPLDEELESSFNVALDTEEFVISFIGTITREEITDEKTIIFSLVNESGIDLNNVTENEKKAVQSAFVGIIQPVRDATENFLSVNTNGNIVTLKLTTNNKDLRTLGNIIASLFSDSNIAMENRLLLLKYRSHKG